MPKCPQCDKELAEVTRQCRYCKADLDLLVDYVNQIDNGVDKAEELTRAGELDKAVWAYLEVLEVDPDNTAARQQVSRIATAVRHFDSVSPTRRWLASAGKKASFILRWMRIGVILVAVAAAFGAGLLVGYGLNYSESGDAGPKILNNEDKSMMAK